MTPEQLALLKDKVAKAQGSIERIKTLQSAITVIKRCNGVIIEFEPFKVQILEDGRWSYEPHATQALNGVREQFRLNCLEIIQDQLKIQESELEKLEA